MPISGGGPSSIADRPHDGTLLALHAAAISVRIVDSLYAKDATEHLVGAATRNDGVRAQKDSNMATLLAQRPKEKDLASRPSP